MTSGCFVRDAEIEHSIVGLRSRITGAKVRNTLVMGADVDYPDAPRGAPPVGIGHGSRIENAIVDKNARIGRKVTLLNEAGVQEAEGDGWVIRDGIVAGNPPYVMGTASSSSRRTRSSRTGPRCDETRVDSAGARASLRARGRVRL